MRCGTRQVLGYADGLFLVFIPQGYPLDLAMVDGILHEIDLVGTLFYRLVAD